MTITRRAFLAAGGTVAASTLLARAAGAQSFPFRPNQRYPDPAVQIVDLGLQRRAAIRAHGCRRPQGFSPQGQARGPRRRDGVQPRRQAARPHSPAGTLRQSHHRCPEEQSSLYGEPPLRLCPLRGTFDLRVTLSLTSQYFMFCRQSDGLTRPLWRISGVRTFTFRRSQTTNSRF